MRKLVRENTLEAFRIFLKRLNVSFTESTIRQFKSHPEFPNLFSVSHTLTKLGIENLAFRPSYSDIQNELPKPLMVYTYDNGGMYLVLEGADSDKVYFVNEQDKTEALPKDDFLKSWSGIAMVATNDKKVREENYKVNALKEFFHSIKYILGAISLASVVLYSILYTTATFDFIKYLFLVANGGGVAVSILLSIQLFDKNNPFIKKICGSRNSKSDCNDILNSKAAYVFGLFAWSEVGLIYFLSLFLYLVFLSETNGLLIVSVLALLAVPYTAYSVYYQWKVAKAWCKLCLLVQCVLFAEFVMALYYFSSASIAFPSFKNYLLLFTIALSTVSAYSLLKPILSEWNLYKKQFPRLNKIKLDKEVFTQLLSRSRQVDISGINPIVIGNAEAKTKLTVITNPVCKPCIETHQKLLKLFQSKEDIAIREIFFTEPDKNEPSYQMAECMIMLHEAKGSDVTKQALTEYYNNPKGRVKWMERFADGNKVNTEASKQLNSHIEWCFKNRFHSTPTILFNDYVLPDAYTIDDLEYLID